ncbi:MAG: MFS transporter [Nanoarchaeota archaeon]|nr:MFS transporter [Nanoarchaeota archaeon]
MLTKNHQHHIDLLVQLKGRLGRIYSHLLIQAFAVSMISVFIPIHLLKLGFSLETVFLFLLIQWGCFSLLAPVAGLVIQRVGVKEVIMLRTPLLIGALVFLIYMDAKPFLQPYFPVAALMLGASSILYTLSITSLFSKSMRLKSPGSDTGKLFSLPQIGTIAGPFVGGFIILKAGFPVLFAIVSVVMLLSLIPIFRIKKNVDHPDFTAAEAFGFFLTHKKLAFLLNIYSIRLFVIYMVVPIAIYLSLNDVLSLGFIVSCISLLTMLMMLKIGIWTDKIGVRSMLKFGAIINCLFFFILGLVAKMPVFIYISVAAGLISAFADVPIESNVYSIAKRHKSPLPFLVFKEFSSAIGRALLFVFLILLADKLELAFYLASASSIVLAFF